MTRFCTLVFAAIVFSSTVHAQTFSSIDAQSVQGDGYRNSLTSTRMSGRLPSDVFQLDGVPANASSETGSANSSANYVVLGALATLLFVGGGITVVCMRQSRSRRSAAPMAMVTTLS